LAEAAGASRWSRRSPSAAVAVERCELLHIWLLTRRAIFLNGTNREASMSLRTLLVDDDIASSKAGTPPLRHQALSILVLLLLVGITVVLV
jgi:hypothetical protein